ncbi:proto-oncogene tyrosine-protein kinase receptor Ret-like [Glandiceps talaboti]
MAGSHGLYFPRIVYHITVPSDLQASEFQPILPLHAMYQGNGVLTYSLECNFIFTPCGFQQDQSSCNITCSGEQPFVIFEDASIISTLYSLRDKAGYTYSLTLRAVFVKSLLLHREESFTEILITVKHKEDLPCPACFLEDTDFFLNDGTGLSRRTFATIGSLVQRERCTDTTTFYSLLTDQDSPDLPFEVESTTAALSITKPLDGHRHYNFKIQCHAVHANQSNTTTEADISVALLRVDKHAPVVEQEKSVVVEVVEKRSKNDTVPMPGLQVLDDDITSPDDYNITVQDDDCSLFRVGNIVTKTVPFSNGTYRTLVQTDLVLKRLVSYSAKICRLDVIFTDNKYNVRKGTSSSVEFNILIFFKEVPLQFEQDSYHAYLRKSASVLATVLKTSLPKYIVGDHSLSYSIVPPHASIIANEYGLAIEPKYGVIYVENPASLKRVTSQNVHFQVKATDGLYIIAMTNVSIEFGRADTGALHCDPKQCSIFDNKTGCERACGIGSPTGKCVWRERKGQGMVYSTCSPNNDTCPDRVCDEWENEHPTLCLQDCVDGSKVSGSVEATVRGISAKGNQVFPIETVEQNSVCDRNCKTLLSFGICSGSLILIVAIAMLRYNQRKKRRRSPKKYNAKDIGSNVSISAIPSDYLDDTPPLVQEVADTWLPNHSRFYKTDFDPKWEFSRSNLLFEKVIGEGEFGRVLKAQALNIRGLTGYTPVAVKMIKNGASSSELRDLMTELHLLKQVNHPNVIKLLGCCTHKGPLYLIVEYCNHGSLRHYLRDSRRLETLYVQDQFNLMVNGDNPSIEETVTSRDLMSFAWQICKGMMYLTEMKLVHRDLATRNVLVAEGKIMKISDFGLTRDIYESDAYLKKSKGRIPVKWMAVESLYDQIYTTKSDVWSFGVLLWEIITLGATPYPGIPPERLFHILKTGYRMERPDNCSDELYDIMLRCWRTSPKERPNFSELEKIFEQMLEQNREYLDLSNDTSLSEGEADQSDDEEVKVSLISSESEDGSQGRTSDESLYGEIKFLTLSRSCSDIQKVRNEQNKMTELPQRPRCHSSTIPNMYNKCGSTEV